MDLIDTRMLLFKNTNLKSDAKKGGLCRHPLIKPSCFPITVVIVFVLLVVLLPLLNSDFQEDETPEWEKSGSCNFSCRAFLTETIPENLTFSSISPIGNYTFDMWTTLLNDAKKNIDLIAFYWTLLAEDTEIKGPKNSDFNDTLGRKVYNLIKKSGINKKIRIIQNLGQNKTMKESLELQDLRAASVRTLDFKKWFGSGVMHTKLWITDNANFYIGSANMDWRALSQVKELGLTIFDCPCLAQEVKKIFEILWDSGNRQVNNVDDHRPRKWHFRYAAKFNATKPLKVYLNGVYSLVYFASSPPQLSPKNREPDLSAIKHVMRSAKRFVYISVMQYAPQILFAKKKLYWPDIDNYIKQVAFENDVEFRLLISQWEHSRANMVGTLKSLLSFNCLMQRVKIQVKLFTVPSFDEKQAKIPYARVNHNKYMVTDNAAYIGTSNWAGDYFTTTSGASIVIFQNYSMERNIMGKEESKNLVKNLEKIFLRDWDSVYAKSVHFNECYTLNSLPRL